LRESATIILLRGELDRQLKIRSRGKLGTWGGGAGFRKKKGLGAYRSGGSIRRGWRLE